MHPKTWFALRTVPESVDDGGGVGVDGYNEGDDDGDEEDSLEYEDDENARLLDVCIDGDVEDLGRNSIYTLQTSQKTSRN